MGRSQELIDLHHLLQQSDRLAITAATGMGGIGKTDLAWHYAEHHKADYPAGTWWIGVDQLVVQVLEYARRMGLPDPREEDNEAAKVQWCYQKWGEAIPDGVRLIVWDDVADAEAYRHLQDYLPPDARFRLLITTRARLGNPVQRLELGVLSRAAAFRLLRKLVDNDQRIAAEVKTAKALCDWVGRLPLGIELIGRHLAIHPNLTLATLLNRLEDRRLKARAMQQVPAEMPYRDSIEAAFELSWQTLSDAAKQVGGLLSLFALAPIPKPLIASCWNGDEEELEDCLDLELAHRSLLSVLDNGSYLLHALTREFFAAKREAEPDAADALRQGFAVAMTAVAKTIPYTVTLEVIARVREAIPHLEAATNHTALLSDEDCGWLHTGTASFYQGQSLWQDAEHWYLACQEMTANRFGDTHPHTATSLNNLAGLYHSQGRYSEAETLYIQALDIRQSQLGQDHPTTATSLNNLAGLYHSQGRYSEAEPLYIQALDIRQSQLRADHPDTASSLNNLAELYRSQGRYAEAEPLYIQALDIRQSQLRADHPDTASSLNNLAVLYESQGRYSEAEPLYIQALDITRSQLGDTHPNTATSLGNLAGLYKSQGRYSEAEPLYIQALDIRRSQLGDTHPDTALSLNNLGLLYESQGRYSEAEPLYLQALDITRSQLGDTHPNTATSLGNLGLLYESQGRYSEAEPLYIQALDIKRSQLGDTHPHTATKLHNLAELYRSQGRYSEAEPLYLQTLTILMQTLGENHPNTQTVWNNFVYLLQQAIETEQAGALSDHPLTQNLLMQMGASGKKGIFNQLKSIVIKLWRGLV